MSDDQAPQMPIPLPLHRVYQERGPLADLAAAAVPIQAQIIDLEWDYGTRDREFWQATLDMLPVLRQALQPFLRLLRSGDPILNLSIAQIKTKYALMNPVYLVDERIDELGIAITAYMPACKKVTRQRLEERHYLLEKLRDLVERVQELTDVVMQEVQAVAQEENQL